MAAKKLIALIAALVLGSVWLFWLGPSIANAMWWSTFLMQVVGLILVGGAILYVTSFGIPARIRPSANILRIVARRRTWGAILMVIGLMIFLFHLADIPWVADELITTVEDVTWTIGEWIAWNPLQNIAIVLGGIGMIVWFVYRVGGIKKIVQAIKSLSLVGGLLILRQWWEMKGTWKWFTPILALTATIQLALGRTADFYLMTFMLIYVTYMGWARDNPLDPPPVSEFYLPVFRILGYPDYAVVFTGFCGIVFIGLLAMVATGQLWTLASAIMLGWLFFIWYVDKRPLTTTAWTRLKVIPADHMLEFDRAKAGAGEISLVQLKLGALRLKEKKGIKDNLPRLIGYTWFETEPIGMVIEPGEIERFEACIRTAHLIFRGKTKIYYGARALTNWVASLK